MNKEQQLKCVEIAPRDTKVILAKNALRLFIEIVDPSDVILLLSITSSFLYQLFTICFRVIIEI